MLLPFQGEHCVAFIPRALPWAMCLLAFQAVFAMVFQNILNLDELYYAMI